jgi:hypothetical protein
MPRIVVRAHKHPFTVVDAETTYKRNLIGSNTGNLVFSQAVHRLLSTSDNELSSSRLLTESASTINAEVDQVVIPLANAFRPRFVSQLDAMSTLVEALTVPVTVLGVGAHAPLAGTHADADVVAPAARRFVRAVLDRSPSIGVRGEFTRDYLRSLGFGDEHVQVIGCPSMFMWGPDLAVERKVDRLTETSPIALNISPYVAQMGPLSRSCAERYPNLMYMGQNIQTLELMLYGTYPNHKRMLAKGAPVTLEHPLIRQDRTRFFLDPTTWFDHLGQYDFAFGTRIHGNIAALLAGTPALLLAHDARTLELAQFHEIPYRLVTEVDATTDLIQLYAETSWERLVKGHSARWDTFAAFLAQHNLRHVYAEGQDPTAFDRGVAALEFPPPVRTLMGASPEELYQMRRDLRETTDELGMARENLRRKERQLERATAFVKQRQQPQLVRSRVWNRVDRTVRRVARMR